MGVEHLCENTKNGSLVFIDGTLDIDIEKDGLSLAPGGLVDQHKGRRIVFKFLPEHLDCRNAVDVFVLKDVGQHFQEVRFTTSKEARDPYANIIRRLIERLAVVVKEADEVLLQFLGDDIFSYFLLDDIGAVLINFDNAVNRSVDVLGKHVTNQHSHFLPQMILNAR